MRLYNQYSDHIIFQQNTEFSFRGFVRIKDISATLINNVNKIKISPKKINYEGDEFIILFDGIKGSYDDYSLIIKGDNEELIVNDIHFGDVILFCGQSNISYTLSCLEKCDEYLSKIDKLEIYGLNLLEADDKHSAFEVHRPAYPQKEICSRFKWEKINSESSKWISGLSIMTSTLLSEKVNYPIGFIHTAMGGLSIESYYPKEAIINKPKVVDVLKNVMGSYYEDEKEYNTKGGRNFSQLGGVFNEKIYPLKGMHFRSFIWYLGESACFDYKRAMFFKASINTIIDYYRYFFNQKDLPILLTGIADDFYPYGDFMGYEYINEVMSNIHKKNVYYIPIHDIEARWLDENNEDIYYHPIHPRNKEPLVIRYIDIIYNNYIKHKSYYFPYIKKVVVEDNNLKLILKSKNKFPIGESFVGFTIAGEDNIYYPSNAIVSGEKEITLTSKYVNNPKYLTYAFTQYPFLCNAKDIKGLPLIPYRSKHEPISKGVYLTNQAILSCDNLSIRESTFGYELGGGFFTDIFNQSNIFHNHVDISLDYQNKTEGNASLKITANPDKKSSYYYFAINMKVGLSGAKHNLAKFHYLMVDIKGTKGCEFHGLLFRANGAIYRLPIVNEKNEIIPFVILDNEFKTYVIDLSRYLDGSECAYNSNKYIIDNITDFDIYYRSKQFSIINIDNFVGFNDLSYASNNEEASKEKNQDNSIVIMKN